MSTPNKPASAPSAPSGAPGTVLPGSRVRVLDRPIHPQLEALEPEFARLQRWQMGRVFRVNSVSPGGHVGLPDEDVDGNRQPSDLHPGFVHPSLVEEVCSPDVVRAPPAGPRR